MAFSLCKFLKRIKKKVYVTHYILTVFKDVFTQLVLYYKIFSRTTCAYSICHKDSFILRGRFRHIYLLNFALCKSSIYMGQHSMAAF